MKKIIKFMLGFCISKIYNVKSGKKVYIGKKTKIVNGKNIVLEDNVSIMPYNMLVSHENGKILFQEGAELGMFSRVAAINKVTIGKNVITGPNVFIADYNHEYCDISKPIKLQGNQYKHGEIANEVSIGEDSWIGTNVVIVGNVKIGKHCVIGANSVVTKNIDDYCVVGGNPFKIIKKYNKEKEIWERI